MTRPDNELPQPDGPTPAREQLPLPRRQRQSHLEPRLREAGAPSAGTPFAPFTAEQSGESQPARPGCGETPPNAPADRAAAFRAGARRGAAPSPRPRRGGPAPRRAEY